MTMMPSAAKPPFWTKGKMILCGLVGLAIFGAANNHQPRHSAEPVARVAQSKNPLDGFDKTDIGLATWVVYGEYCAALPRDLDTATTFLMQAKGKRRMAPVIAAVNEVRQQFGDKFFCSYTSNDIRKAAASVTEALQQ